MRKFLLLLTLVCAASLGLQAQGTLVNFKIKGSPVGTFKIIGMLGGQNYLADTVVAAKEGEILWKKAVPLPGGLYYLVYPDQKTFVQFLLDKDQEFSMVASPPDVIGTMAVDGCLDNVLFYENLRFEAEFRRRVDSLDAALKSQAPGSLNIAYLENQKAKQLERRKAYLANLKANHPTNFFTVFKIAGQNPELQQPRLANGAIDSSLQVYLYRESYWNGTDVSDERLLRTPVIANKLKTFMTLATPQNADSVIKSADKVIALSKACDECFKFVVNWIAIQYEKPTVMGGEAILVHLVDKYFTDDHANWFSDKPEELTKIRKKVNDMRPSLLGKTAQDIRCKTIDGGYKSLYELKGAAKILFMYSTSCSHCQERAPVLVEVVKKWKPYGLEVFALCLDPDEDKWREFVTKYHMEEFHNTIDPKYESLYYKKYHIDVTPELYIMDASNKIISKDLHPNQIETILKKAYGLK